MTFESLSLPVIYLFLTTAFLLLISQDWRVNLIALGVQYVGVFILVGITWPLEMAIIKLATGWIVVAIFAMEMVRMSNDQSLIAEIQGEPLRTSDRIFRIFLAIMIGIAVFSMAREAAKWILNATYYQILGSLSLVGMGILILSINDRHFRVFVGLLTFLSGFEIIFATLETSALVAGFFTFVSFGIALLGTYFISSHTIQVER